MKYLLIITMFVICLSVIGQSELDSGLVYVSEIDFKPNIPITFQYMFAYAYECYNDSISVEYDWYMYFNDTIKVPPSIDPGFTYGYIGRWSIYEHKPPTFDGFINWLRLKFE